MTEEQHIPSLIVREQFCKGCGICVAFCPCDVLALRNGRVLVEFPELCSGCGDCERLCPDFALALAPTPESLDV